MASNLAGGQCLGQHSVCLMRAAILDDDCTPQGGTNSGIVTVGIVTATATPEYRDERRIEPTNGCGDIMFTYNQLGCLLRETLSGELIFHDWEMMQVLFGGTLILGVAGGPFAGEVIGWAKPSCPDDLPKSVYLEFIVKNASQEAGECQVAGSEFPTHTGHIFPKVNLTAGAQTYNDQSISLPFDGFSVRNPSLVKGPWNDYPGAGAMPASPHIEVGYSQTQYDAILAYAGCGFVNLPVTYSG